MNPRDDTGLDADLLEFGPPLDAAPSAAPPQEKSERPLGCLDGINGRIVGGWALDPEQPSERLTVCIYEGARELGRTTASLLREDLQKRGKGDGWHGFRFSLPLELFDGATYQISARVAGSDAELPGSPKTLSTDALPRPASVDAQLPGLAAFAEEQAASPVNDVPPEDDLPISGLPARLVSASTSPQGNPGRALGWLDGINGRIVDGWAFDPDRPLERLTVCIYEGERELAARQHRCCGRICRSARKGTAGTAFGFRCRSNCSTAEPTRYQPGSRALPPCWTAARRR